MPSWVMAARSPAQHRLTDGGTQGPALADIVERAVLAHLTRGRSGVAHQWRIGGRAAEAARRARSVRHTPSVD